MSFRHSKIVCTIGPASRSPRMIDRLLSAGMDVARLNISHGTREEHAKSITLLRAASGELEKPIAILADLQGPKIRTGPLAGGGPGMLRGDNEALPGTEHDRPAPCQRSRPDFRPLKVGQNRNWLFVFARGRTKQRDALRMLLACAVRKIKPCDVHSRAQQAVNHPRRTARRPNRAYNLGVTKTHGLFCGQLFSSDLIFQWMAVRNDCLSFNLCELLPCWPIALPQIPRELAPANPRLC